MERCLEFDSHSLSDRATIRHQKTDQFTFSYIRIYFPIEIANIKELCVESAIIPGILADQLKNNKHIIHELDSLYGASLEFKFQKLGKYLVLSLEGSYANILDSKASQKYMQILQKALLDPFYKEKYFSDSFEKSIRSLHLNIIAHKENNYLRLNYLLIKNAFPKSIFGRFYLGEEEDLCDLRPSTVYSKYQKIISDSYIYIFQISNSNIILNKTFLNNIPKSSHCTKNNFVFSEVNRLDFKTIVEKPYKGPSFLGLAFRTPYTYKNPNYYVALVFNKLLDYLLHLKIRNEKGLAYYAGCELTKHDGLWCIRIGTKAKNFKCVKKIINSILHAVISEDYTDSELAKCKEGIINSIYSVIDSPTLRIAFLFDGLFFDNVNELEDFFQKIKSVRKEDITKIASLILIASIVEIVGADGNK